MSHHGLSSYPSRENTVGRSHQNLGSAHAHRDNTVGRSQQNLGTAQRKDKKDPPLLEKISTLGRSKKKKEEEEEAQLILREGKDAIESPGLRLPVEEMPTVDEMEEGEERSMIVPECLEDWKLQEVIRLVVDWMNDELADQRIIVKDIREDIFDGLVIQKLLERLTGVKIEVPEVSQSEEGQRQKLRVVLQVANQILAQPQWQHPKWTAELIHAKDLVAILHLMVALALHFRAPVRFPEHCTVQVLVITKRDGALHNKYITEEITAVQDELGLRGVRDAFDTLFDHAPDKLKIIKESLLGFVNKHLNKINLEVTDLETQFQDGVYLVLLIGLLDGYFVPLYSYHLQVSSFEQKVHNVSLAFELMREAGFDKPKSRPEDIVNGDMKSTLRLLYTLFNKFKHR